MAQKQYCVKSIELTQHFDNTSELFFAAERTMNQWISSTVAGRWCKKHLKDLTFRINYQYNNEYPVVNIMARLEESDYTLYLLTYGGTDEKTNA